jgi:2-haloacid dehalogenase
MSKILALDLYGTLLDPSSISSSLRFQLPERHHHLAGAITQAWRQIQLSYTFRLNSMGQYRPFSEVTRLALADAVHAHGAALSQEASEGLLEDYSRLRLFNDVPDLLGALDKDKDVKAVVFSNGTPQQLSACINSSAALRGSVLAREGALVSTHDVARFKPAMEVYQHLLEKLGLGLEERGRVVLVSSNPFDIVGGREFGFGTIWVDRTGKGWGDQLGRPERVVKRLGEVMGG